MPTYLIIANQTLGGAELISHVSALAAKESCALHLVVPATPPKEHLTWTEGEAKAIADKRLEAGMAGLRSLGVEVSGEVGDASPLLAADDALRDRTVDGIIVCTLPVGLSRWLKVSLPDRIERRFDLPVTHLVVEPKPSSATS